MVKNNINFLVRFCSFRRFCRRHRQLQRSSILFTARLDYYFRPIKREHSTACVPFARKNVTETTQHEWLMNWQRKIETKAKEKKSEERKTKMNDENEMEKWAKRICIDSKLCAIQHLLFASHCHYSSVGRHYMLDGP